MQSPLITKEEVSILARPIATSVDKEKVYTFIREAEMFDIKPRLGDDLYLAIKEDSSKYDLLMAGGIYEDRCGHNKSFEGLKTALAYYSYARIVKGGDGHVTRFGFVEKNDEYSNHSEFKEKMQEYNDAFTMADQCLHGCLNYLVETKNELYKGSKRIKSNRMKCKVIGD